MDFQYTLFDLTTSEITLFLLICKDSYEHNNRKGDIQISNLTIDLYGNEDDWTKLSMDMMNHLLEIKGYEELGSGGKCYYNFFELYTYIESKKEIHYIISEKGYKELFNILRYLKLNDIVLIKKLKGKYPKRLSQILLQHNISKYYETNLNEFIDLMEIPHNYTTMEFTRTIIKPCISKINNIKLTKNLHYYYKKDSKKATSIVFEWE